ncbi:hypothetical protein BDM02DRAFT_3115559 [Thelephora ganbajun]|uniref:Uncharacterized protein n=1 Tax=Thelephora ganbajun TaxID=370292 RepID=A0ACB6ZFN0_THEGA|nr:hypothetical protein BDM02DRAFT_3115559 [Thelephora ganbajun]
MAVFLATIENAHQEQTCERGSVLPSGSDQERGTMTSARVFTRLDPPVSTSGLWQGPKRVSQNLTFIHRQSVPKPEPNPHPQLPPSNRAKAVRIASIERWAISTTFRRGAEDNSLT